ncbi:hypothetical protein ACP0HM_32700 [Escherichia coli]
MPAVLPSRVLPLETIEWDEAFKKMDDPSGRAVGVHQSAYTVEMQKQPGEIRGCFSY